MRRLRIAASIHHVTFYLVTIVAAMLAWTHSCARAVRPAD